MLIFGHEPGGGSQPNCQAGSSVLNKSLFFMDPLTGNQLGVLVHPRAQTDRENCTWHNFNVIPTYKGYIAVSGSYQAGISVIDFTNPALPKEIASADPAPLSTTSNITGGDWSTYVHNGVLYESDIRRGLITWDLVDAAADRARTFALSNPQTQAISYAQDNEGPTIDVASPLAGARFELDETVLAAVQLRGRRHGRRIVRRHGGRRCSDRHERSGARASRSRPPTRPATCRRRPSNTRSSFCAAGGHRRLPRRWP